MNKEATIKEFEILIRTKQFERLRLLHADKMEPVIIATKVLSKFFSNRNCKGKDIIPEMVQKNIIRYYKHDFKGFTSYSFEVLTPGVIDLNLLELKGRELDKTGLKMLEYLKRTGLKANAPSTFYFDAFLKFKDNAARLFFSADNFSSRVHTPVSNLHTPYRENLTIDNEATTSFDVATMQPLLLSKILYAAIGANEYTEWINAGHDIYEMLKNKAGLQSRDKSKKRFFEILFSQPSNELAEMFGGADWITWINKIKSIVISQNPHSKEKPYSNLAWLLQNCEVRIMKQVWERLIKADIPFLSVHDEIIVKQSDFDTAHRLFNDVLKANFQYYKLNYKNAPVSADISKPPVSETQEQPKAQEQPPGQVDINKLAYDLLQPQNNYTHDTMIQLISITIGATDDTATAYLSQMLTDGHITHAAHVNRYYLSNSTPF